MHRLVTTTKHLRDARADAGGALHAPVAGGNGVAQPPRDRVLIYRRRQVDLPPCGNTLNPKPRQVSPLMEHWLQMTSKTP